MSYSLKSSGGGLLWSLHAAYTNHWASLKRAETKRKKEFSLETWENEISNTVSQKNNEKAKKYYTNEGAN